MPYTNSKYSGLTTALSKLQGNEAALGLLIDNYLKMLPQRLNTLAALTSQKRNVGEEGLYNLLNAFELFDATAAELALQLLLDELKMGSRIDSKQAHDLAQEVIELGEYLVKIEYQFG